MRGPPLPFTHGILGASGSGIYCSYNGAHAFLFSVRFSSCHLFNARPQGDPPKHVRQPANTLEGPQTIAREDIPLTRNAHRQPSQDRLNSPENLYGPQIGTEINKYFITIIYTQVAAHFIRKIPELLPVNLLRVTRFDFPMFINIHLLWGDNAF